jgi:hypothetical protein
MPYDILLNLPFFDDIRSADKFTRNDILDRLYDPNYPTYQTLNTPFTDKDKNTIHHTVSCMLHLSRKYNISFKALILSLHIFQEFIIACNKKELKHDPLKYGCLPYLSIGSILVDTFMIYPNLKDMVNKYIKNVKLSASSDFIKYITDVLIAIDFSVYRKFPYLILLNSGEKIILRGKREKEYQRLVLYSVLLTPYFDPMHIALWVMEMMKVSSKYLVKYYNNDTRLLGDISKMFMEMISFDIDTLFI